MSDAWAKATESVFVCGENSKSKVVLGSVSQLLISPPKPQMLYGHYISRFHLQRLRSTELLSNFLV
jgi:hypothetical protein